MEKNLLTVSHRRVGLQGFDEQCVDALRLCPRGFLMPVKLLSRMFRGKFLAYLKQAHRRGELTCKGRLQDLVSYHAFNAWLSPLYKKDWVVYAKPPWNGPENALKYLARYTHRVAIANSRLQSIDDGQVTFTYKDYRHHRQRTLTLSATEFIRRFMMHVLPNGFVRIRYFGFLAVSFRRACESEECCQLIACVGSGRAAERRGANHRPGCRSYAATTLLAIAWV